MSDERKPMTDEELAAIQGRLDAITPPPWFHVLASIVGTKDDPEASDATCVCCTEWGYCGDDPQANAEFIAAAPTDISRLLDEVKRLREENKRLCGELERVHEEAAWLAESLEIESPYCYECEFKDERYCEYEENITWCAHAPDGTNDTCDQSWRKAARKAIEEERNAE